MLVDDYARYDAHPLLLARIAFPYGIPPKGRQVSPDQIRDWLLELESLDMIVTYQNNGVPVLQLKRWTERIRAQNPSRFPDPDANACQRLLSNVVSFPRMTANPALPAPSSAPSSAPSPSVKKKAASPEEARQQARQFAANQARLTELEATQDDDRSQGERMEIKKVREMLREIQKKQAAADFSPVEATT